MRTFSGTMQLYTAEMHQQGEVEFNNGTIISNSFTSSPTATTNCITTIVVVTHTCTHNGEHSPGQTCRPPFENDAYYSMQAFIECNTEFNYNGIPGNFIIGGTTGVSWTQGFINSLSPTQIIFMNANANLKSAILTHLGRGGAWNIAKDALDACLNGKISLDLAILIINNTDSWSSPMINYLKANSFSQTSVNLINQFAVFTQQGYKRAAGVDIFNLFINGHINNNQVNNFLVFAGNNIIIAEDILEYIKTNNNSLQSIQTAEELMNLYNQDLQNGNLDTNIVNMTLIALKGNYFNQPFNGGYYNAIDPYTEENLQNSANWPAWYFYFTAQCAFIRLQHPEWSDLKIYWEASKEMVHIALDVVGLVPVAGEVADLANGIIYTIEGDGVNASLSFTSMIPVGGWIAAGAKFAIRSDGLKYVVKGNSALDFGTRNSKKFRELCDLAPGDPRQAHHIISRASNITEHVVVQRATQAASNQGFHIDSALNGVAVAAWRNQPNHSNYNNIIFNKLELFYQSNSNATPLQCYNQLQLIIQQAKTAIVNNPNTHLNDLIF